MNLSRIMCVTKQCNKPNFHSWLMMIWPYQKMRACVCVCVCARESVWAHVSMIHFNIISPVYALFCQLISSCEIPKPKCYVSFFLHVCYMNCSLHPSCFNHPQYLVKSTNCKIPFKVNGDWMANCYISVQDYVICDMHIYQKGDNALFSWFKLLKG